MRVAYLVLAVALTVGADGRAQETPRASVYRPDPFVVAGDACGASQFSHLVGRESAVLEHASLPPLSRILRTSAGASLEYKPQRLNVVLGGGDRIVAIGCF